MRHLVKLNNELAFDEVPAEVFNERAFAINEEGGPRYDTDYIIIDGREITINLSGVDTNIIGILGRIANVNPVTGAVVGGFVREPSHVKFQKQKSLWLTECKTGVKYKQSK